MESKSSRLHHQEHLIARIEPLVHNEITALNHQRCQTGIPSVYWARRDNTKEVAGNHRLQGPMTDHLNIGPWPVQDRPEFTSGRNPLDLLLARSSLNFIGMTKTRTRREGQ